MLPVGREGDVVRPHRVRREGGMLSILAEHELGRDIVRLVRKHRRHALNTIHDDRAVALTFDVREVRAVRTECQTVRAHRLRRLAVDDNDAMDAARAG